MVNRQALQLTSLPTEILFLVVFSIDNAKDLRSLASTNHYFRDLAGPHTVTAQLWFTKVSRDIAPEDLLRTANEWGFPLTTDYAKNLIMVNAPSEPSYLCAEPPGPRRALQRIERVLHVVERFGLFLQNTLAVNYYYPHDWDAYQRVADEVEQYLEDLGWVQFYRGQMHRGIDSMIVSTVETDIEFEAVAFEAFAKKLREEIAVMSTITVASPKKSSNSSGNRQDDVDNSSNNNELFASEASEEIYLKWTSLIQDQLNFFSMEQYIMDKFKPPSKWQLAEYLTAVVAGLAERGDNDNVRSTNVASRGDRSINVASRGDRSTNVAPANGGTI
ncbi:9319_t:CDS:1 [Ambispora gerdemannii]|uniref:9319_t:CDS:1 n=1 Tax=Ambispora gerdemannii TaxID=144530 RepID=A0A9N9CGY8_9GLOM|nr:9319_t:CDS:1 [Ambispora gerdemannii]